MTSVIIGPRSAITKISWCQAPYAHGVLACNYFHVKPSAFSHLSLLNHSLGAPVGSESQKKRVELYTTGCICEIFDLS